MLSLALTLFALILPHIAHTRDKTQAHCLRDAVVRVYRSNLDGEGLALKEQEHLRRILADPSVSGEENIRKGFDYIFEARLRHLTTEQAEIVRNVLRTKVRVKKPWRSGQRAEGEFLEKSKRIKLKLSPEYQGSFLHYAVLIHELEHAVNDVRIRSNPALSAILDNVFDVFWAEGRHLDELSAMRREWEFLHRIPKEEKLQFIRDLRGGRMPKTDELTFEEKCIIDSCEPLEAFLKSQMDERQYDLDGMERSRIKKAAFKAVDTIFTTLTTTAASLWTAGWTLSHIRKQCGEANSSTRMNPTVSRFCAKVFGPAKAR